MNIRIYWKKLKDKGLRWAIWRLKKELLNPQNNALRIFFDNLYFFFTKLIRNNENKAKYYIYGIYDLEVCPTTFNIAEFLCELEIETVRRGRTSFVVVFVPKKKAKSHFEENYERVVDSISQEWRVHNILVQTAQIHQMCRGIYLLPDRNSLDDILRTKEIFPEPYSRFTLRGYNTRNFYNLASRPGIFIGLKAPEQGKRYINNYLREKNINKKVVTIVIRDYEYDRARNSNIEEWAKFVKFLNSENFHPLVIPDTDNAFSGNLPFETKNLISDCCWNIPLRMALYEASFVNFSVLNGSGAIMLFNPHCHCIFMKTLGIGSITSNDDEVLKTTGYRAGEPKKFMTENQIFSTLEDTFENIRFEFENYLKKFS